MNLDGNVPTGESLTDEEILELLDDTEDAEADVEEQISKPPVSRADGLNAMIIVQRFAERDPSVSADQLLFLQRLQQQLFVPHGKHKKQSTLEDYFRFCAISNKPMNAKLQKRWGESTCLQ